MKEEDSELLDRLASATAFVRGQIDSTPRIAVVLGSGLGGFAGAVEHAASIPYSAIPHFPCATVEGNAGRLFIGTVAGTPVAVMQGRVHGYEDYSPQEVTFPVRLLGSLGVAMIVITNAAGGIRLDLKQGELVLLADHINFTGINPLMGLDDNRLGPRFFDMTDAYAARLRLLAKAVAAEQGIPLSEGVYLGLSGPNFETPAEIKAFRALGADLVGMSTVHEVIVARQIGMRVLGISCVTNMAAGILDEEITHEEILETGRQVQDHLTRLLTALLPRLEREMYP